MVSGGLRALLEGLVLFAIEPTEESLRLVTFNNRVTPFGPIPVDEARKLLKGWLRPSPIKELLVRSLHHWH